MCLFCHFLVPLLLYSLSNSLLLLWSTSRPYSSSLPLLPPLFLVDRFLLWNSNQFTQSSLLVSLITYLSDDVDSPSRLTFCLLRPEEGALPVLIPNIDDILLMTAWLRFFSVRLLNISMDKNSLLSWVYVMCAFGWRISGSVSAINCSSVKFFNWFVVLTFAKIYCRWRRESEGLLGQSTLATDTTSICFVD